MGALWQTLAYIFCILSIQHVENSAFYTTWFVLDLLAPLWTNAFVHLAFGLMVFTYTSSTKIYENRLWPFGLCFFLLMTTAFTMQASGAIMAFRDQLTDLEVMRGLHIYMGGIGLQQTCIIYVLALAFRLQKQMNRDLRMASKSRLLQLLYIIYAVLLLINVRSLFRLIEYSNGLSNTIPAREAYQYVFDSAPMLTVLVLNVVHSGIILATREANRKEKNAAGKHCILGRAEKQQGEEGEEGINHEFESQYTKSAVAGTV